MQRATGVTPELKQYVVAAISELKTDIYRQHLPLAVVERMQRYHHAQGRARLPMIEQLRAMVQAGEAPGSPAAQGLARQWSASFRDMLGDDPSIIARYRALSMSEPLLRMGRGMTDEMIAFIDAAMKIADKA
jgi:hypothetical protein